MTNKARLDNDKNNPCRPLSKIIVNEKNHLFYTDDQGNIDLYRQFPYTIGKGGCQLCGIIHFGNDPAWECLCCGNPKLPQTKRSLIDRVLQFLGMELYV